MTTYGPPGQPDDPYQRPPGTPGGPPPVDPTLPQWGQPPSSGAPQWGQQPGAEPPTAPQWGQQPGAEPQWGQPGPSAEPPTAPMWSQPPGAPQPQPPAGGYPPPGGFPPPTSGPGYPPGPGSEPGYPPPSAGSGYPPPSSGAGYPPPGQPSSEHGGYPPAGPFPPAGPTPGGQWGAPATAPGGYGPPPAPPAKTSGRKVGLIIALVVLLLLCPCLGIAGWAAYQAGDDDTPEVSLPTTTSVPVEPTREPSVAPSTAEPSPTEEDDEKFAKGDCVVNDGTDDDAELRKVPCGPNTYEVLLRIPGTADGDRCKTRAPKSTANYVHDNSVDFLDYVLCLRKRS